MRNYIRSAAILSLDQNICAGQPNKSRAVTPLSDWQRLKYDTLSQVQGFGFLRDIVHHSTPWAIFHRVVNQAP
jgi:hypothetical protein